MKRLVTIAIACLFAAPVQAKTYEIRLNGMITRQTSSEVPTVVKLGDRLRLMARFDDELYVDWNGTGFYAAGFPKYFPSSGARYFRVDLNNLTYESSAEWLDGSFAFFEDYIDNKRLAFPGVVGREGRVAGLLGWMIPGGNIPELTLGSASLRGYRECFPGGQTCIEEFSEVKIGSSKFVLDNYQLYSNSYSGPNFEGEWDFENSYFAAVPEPINWGLFVVGFGAVGMAVRRSRPKASLSKL